MLLNRRRCLQNQGNALRQEIAYRERFTRNRKNPVIVPCYGHFGGQFHQITQMPGFRWNQFHSLTHLLNDPMSHLFFPIHVWENLMVALMSQEEWLMSWALLVSDGQMKEMQSNEVLAYMRALKLNGLVLVYPPKGVIRHTSVELQDVPIEHLLSQITDRTISEETAIHHLKGQMLMGFSIRGAWDLRAIDVSVTCSLQLGY